MIEVPITDGDHRIATGFLQVRDHLFGDVAMFADHEMDVIIHDRARVAGVRFALDHASERVCDRAQLSLGEPPQRKLQDLLRFFVERADLMGEWLDSLPSVVQFPELRDDVASDEPGHAPAQVVW
jgi:hypothetical protein